jgi:flagellar biosynthesis chaperone FliJ
MDPETIFNEIQKYDPYDAQEVSRRIRSSADMELVIDKLLDLYQQVIEEYAGNVSDQQAEYKAAAAYLRSLSPRLKEMDKLKNYLENVFNSASWRITRPLRQIHSWLGRIPGKQKGQPLTRDKLNK